MASKYDDSDFVDRDFQVSQAGHAAVAGLASSTTVTKHRPPTREELDNRVGQAQQKLAELKRAQDELERERAALEEARRRRTEFQAGREEMLQHLTRGVAVLEQAEFTARRDSEQMSKTLGGLRESLQNIESIHDENWNQDNWSVELTKALATIENARLEWNGARLKWALLNGTAAEPVQREGLLPSPTATAGLSFWQMCKIGAALTWPLALLGLIALVLLLVLRLR